MDIIDLGLADKKDMLDGLSQIGELIDSGKVQSMVCLVTMPREQSANYYYSTQSTNEAFRMIGVLECAKRKLLDQVSPVNSEDIIYV